MMASFSRISFGDPLGISVTDVRCWSKMAIFRVYIEAVSCISHEPHLNRAFQFMLSVGEMLSSSIFSTGFYLPMSLSFINKCLVETEVRKQ